MIIDDRYEIKVVIIEKTEQGTGDVYDKLAIFKQEHPHSGYFFGFIVVDRNSGFIPNNCNEWNDSVEDAISDYEVNCK